MTTNGNATTTRESTSVAEFMMKSNDNVNNKDENEKVIEATKNASPSICVIGCGPGGMSLCHALERKLLASSKKNNNENGKEDNIPILPRITVFERANGPGGVWRAQRSFVDDPANNNSNNNENNGNNGNKNGHDTDKLNDKSTPTETTTRTNDEGESVDMYEALWTNGCKETIEFFDYTYDEHFGCAVPTYLPRQAFLEYMIARCVKHCPDFFQKYVRFNTSVTHVQWISDKQQFHVQTTTTTTNTLDNGSTRKQQYHQDYYFDKVIWAAGQNGRPHVPETLDRLFTPQHYRGTVLHSSNASCLFKQHVQDKRILLIGGSYSAEDLALMACKLHVSKVYIVSRYATNVVSWMASWPRDCVQIIPNVTPTAIQNGKDILLTELLWRDNQYQHVHSSTTLLKDIDTVILCTGYRECMDMMHSDLALSHSIKENTKLEVPEDWTMTPSPVTALLDADKIAATDVTYSYMLVHPLLYWGGFLLSNPNCIYMRQIHHDFNIISIDASATLIMEYLTGSKPMPSVQQMKQANIQQALRELDLPYIRYYADSNFQAAWDRLGEDDEDDDNKKEEEEDEDLWYAGVDQFYDYDICALAHTMKEGNYPLDLGNATKLSPLGRLLRVYSNYSYLDRADIEPHCKSWKTFRDSQQTERYKSFFTGTSAVPLAKRWIDIDENNGQDVVMSLLVSEEAAAKRAH